MWVKIVGTLSAPMSGTFTGRRLMFEKNAVFYIRRKEVGERKYCKRKNDQEVREELFHKNGVFMKLTIDN